MLIQIEMKDIFKLLKKDLILLKLRLLIVISIMIPFILIGTSLSEPSYDRTSWIAIFLMNLVYIYAILPLEGKDRNHKLHPSLPSTRKDIVRSRYLGLLVFYVVSLAFYFLISSVINLSRLPINLSWIKLDTLLASSFSIIFLASISLFLNFVGGKGLFLFFAYCLFPYMFFYMFVKFHPFNPLKLFDGKYNVLILLFLLLLLFVSYSLSLWAYKGREFV